MSKPALGLAEHEVKHLRLTSNVTSHYLSRVVSEPPNFKLIKYQNIPWYVPLPWTHYLLLKSKKAKTRVWMLYSIYMSPRHLTGVRFRKVSQPIVPNVYDYTPIYRPCQNGGTKYQDVNKVITSFWDGGFNGDLRPHHHPVVREIAKRARTGAFSDVYFRKWEKLSIEELLDMPWPQNVRI